MSDPSLPPGSDPFAGIDPHMTAPAAPLPPGKDPFADIQMPEFDTSSSATGAFTRSAIRSALPAAGSLAGAGAGAETGVALGAAIPGLGETGIGEVGGGIIGGIGGSIFGAKGVAEVQNWALSKLPDSWREELGMSDRQERVDQGEHPVASFLGGLAPYAMTMRPGGFSSTALPENATALQRILAHPATARLFGGAAMGGMELGQEAAEGDPIDWRKVAISTGFGLVFNKPTKFGEAITDLGAEPVRTGLAHVLPGGLAQSNIGDYRYSADQIAREQFYPTLADAADARVMGPGVTESVFQGTQAQDPQAQMTAQSTAQNERALLGPSSEPDIHGIARRLDPDTFERHDALTDRLTALRSYAARLANPGDEDFAEIEQKRAQINLALNATNPRSRDAASYRAQLADLDNQQTDLETRRAAYEAGNGVETPELAAIRQHILATDIELRDLAPAVSAAYRRAADATGQIEPVPAAEPVPVETSPSGEVAPAEQPIGVATEPAANAVPTPAKSIEDQKAFIANDVARQMIAAGRPAEEANEAGQMIAQRYATRAGRFQGALGTAEELYRREGAVIRGGRNVQAPEPAIEPERELELYQPAEVTGPDGRTKRFDNDLSYWQGGVDALRAGKGADEKRVGRQFKVLSAIGAGEGAVTIAPKAARAIAMKHPDVPDDVWKRLPELIADPLAAFPHKDGGVDVLINARTAADEPIVVGIRDGQIRTITPHNNTPEITGDQRTADLIIQALTKGRSRVYLRDGDIPARGVQPYGANSLAPGAARPRIGTGVSIVTRADVIKKVGGVFYQDADEAARNQRELFQGALGKIRLTPGERPIITLMRDANASTFIHETGHDFLEQLMRDAAHSLAPDIVKNDAQSVLNYLGLKRADDLSETNARGTRLSRRATEAHEKFARAFEQYVREGIAPSKELAGVFAKFKNWLMSIYRTIKGLGSPINEDIRGVFDRMLAEEPQRTVIAPERPSNLTLADIHEADARETDPMDAAPVSDRIAAERERLKTEPPPEVAHEVTKADAEFEAARTGANAGGETGGGATGRGEMVADRGQSEPVPSSSGLRDTDREERAGGNPATPEGGGIREPAGQRGGAGTPAGTKPLAPGPSDLFGKSDSDLIDLAGNIRVENLTDQADIAKAIHESADRNDDFQSVRGQVTKGQMLDLAESMGLDASRISETQLGKLLGGSENLGAKILAARKLVVQSAGIVSDAMRQAALSGSDEDAASLAVAISRHDMIQSALAGVTAEWGRAGNAFHSLLEGWGQAQSIDQFLKDNTGRTLFQLKEIAKLGATLDDAPKVSKFVRDSSKRTFGRMVLEYWINGLISGPATHTTYMIGNTILALEKAGPETAAAALIGRLREGLGREGPTVRMGEVGAQLKGAAQGLAPALKASFEAFRAGQTATLPGEGGAPELPFSPSDFAQAPSLDETAKLADAAQAAFGIIRGLRDGFLSGGAILKAGGIEGAPTIGLKYSPTGQIPDIALKGVNVLPTGTLARLPSRFIAAIHTLFRSMNYSMEKNGLAFRTAAEEGLTGDALDARIGQIRSNPSPDIMDQARSKATDLTLMGKGGEFVQALSRLTNVEVGGFPILKFIDPFVHIAANIMDQSLLQRTPVGLLSSEIRADLMGRNGSIAADTAAAKMLVGTALSLTFGTLAAEGLASGSGPSDPNKAAMWRLAGNQAHSVRIGDVWYDVHRLGPMGMLMGVAADMYDVAHLAATSDMETAGTALMHAFTQNILDESFMKGPADLIQAIEDKDRYGASYVRNFLSSFVPYSVGMAQMARASDPYSRQARTIMDAIKAKIPGLSETLFPRRDIWGEPMLNPDAVGHAGLTAIYERQLSNDPVNKAMLDLGMGPAPVERRIRNVQLNDQQFDDYARIAGRMTKMRLDAIVRSPDFQTWPVDIRHEVIDETITQSREAARGIMLMKYPTIAKLATQQRLAKLRGQ